MPNKEIIEELETLRDEMQDDYDSINYYLSDDSDIGYSTCLSIYIKKINKRIEELKVE